MCGCHKIGVDVVSKEEIHKGTNCIRANVYDMLLYYSHGNPDLCYSVCSYQSVFTVNFDDVSCEAAVLFTRGNPLVVPPVGTCHGLCMGKKTHHTPLK